jgi:hypothetical protein
MILKERDTSEHRDSGELSRAGAKAELQMAYYLRRSFGTASEILVLNDIRLEVEDEVKEACQIDHLLIHRYGLIIVESKSVIGRISVNEREEWIRSWSGGARGMPSPVIQAHRQADLLRKALNAERDSILSKFLFGKIQKGFGNCPIEILIAISDEGIIDRKKNIPELFKADQVPDQIKMILERHRKAARLIGGNLNFTNNDGVMDFSEQECSKIAKFLMDHHYPLRETVAAPLPKQKEKPKPTPPELPTSPGICPRCGKTLVSRVARKGKNVGAQFWGCSGFPKCRYSSGESAATE